ncbi:MAG TPA: BTAD domain-containing putative transcriptional regulator [Streptosporangiaceae bacterium]
MTLADAAPRVVVLDGAAPQDGTGARLTLCLLDGFQLRVDDLIVALPIPIQRLLAYLAVQQRPVSRSATAGMLWLDVPERRASGSLRSALWRLGKEGIHPVVTSPTHLGLCPAVAVDLYEALATARSLTDQRGALRFDAQAMRLLSKDLLPDWYDEWLFVERERFRQIRLHALEALCEQLTSAGCYALAIESGLAAVAAEPLRESAHRALIKAHLAEGNRSEAMRQYKRLCELLRTDLTADPSEDVTSLVRWAPPRTPEATAPPA